MGSKKCPAMLTQHFDKLSEFLLAMSSVESSSKFNLLCFFLVFAVNFGSGLSGLGSAYSFILLAGFSQDKKLGAVLLDMKRIRW
jgi:cytosine/uracil/thiamine/allantoin permease